MEQYYNLSNHNEYRVFVESYEKDLSPIATKSSEYRYIADIDSSGFDFDFERSSIKTNSFRTPFQIDFDKIINSRYFPLLANKTQIFIAPESTHYRTRSSHTLTVSMLAENLAVGLGLNRELVKAIAFGHDVGHTPFGHMAEKELDDILKEIYCHKSSEDLKKHDPAKYRNLLSKYSNIDFRSWPIKEIIKDDKHLRLLISEYLLQDHDKMIFSHSKQSFRLITILGAKNISAQAVYGIIAHPFGESDYLDFQFDIEMQIERPKDIMKEKYDVDKPCKRERFLLSPKYCTFEGQVVKIADYLAFTLHDFDDATRSGIITIDMVQKDFENQFPGFAFDEYFGLHRYSRYINEILEYNKNRDLKKIVGESISSENKLIIPDDIGRILAWFSGWIRLKVHESEKLERKNNESREYVRKIFNYLNERKQDICYWKELSSGIPEFQIKFSDDISLERKICDFISIQTDNELISIYEQIFGPRHSEKRLYIGN